MNKCQIIGRTTAEIQTKYTNSNKAVSTFTLAVDRYPNETDYIPCVAWEKRAETLAQYVKKGDRLAIAGRIQVRQYETQQGEKRTITEVIVEDFDLIQPKREEQGTRQNPKAVDSFDDFVPF